MQEWRPPYGILKGLNYKPPQRKPKQIKNSNNDNIGDTSPLQQQHRVDKQEEASKMPSTSSAPAVKSESASGGSLYPITLHGLEKASADVKSEAKTEQKSLKRKYTARNTRKPWTKEELAGLHKVSLDVLLENAARIAAAPELAERDASKVYNKIRQLHTAAIKALNADPAAQDE